MENEKKFLYVGYTIAQKEKEKGFEWLNSLNFQDVAEIAKNFINAYPETCSFETHIENCFEQLRAEYVGASSVEWTPLYFKSFY